MGGGGHAVLNPKQPKLPIQKQLHLPLKTPLALLFFKFELVLPNCSLSTPECPFEVVNTPRYHSRCECFRGLTKDKLESRMGAKPGAGDWDVVGDLGVGGYVETMKRPSTEKSPPRV